MSSPLVSVVMPCYNVAAYVADALRSVFAQSSNDFEVILVNDGSPDTEELETAILPWRDKIRYIAQSNGGVASARNTALRNARGKWIAALDPDDIWEPAYLETQLRFAEERPEAVLLYGDAIVFGHVTEETRLSVLSPSRGEATFDALIEERCVVPHCASLVLRQAVLDAGGYDESLTTGEDFDLWLRITSQGGKVEYHQEVVSRYRRRNNSLVSDTERSLKNGLVVLQKARLEYASTDAARQRILQQESRIESRLTLIRAKRALAENDIPTAIGGFQAVQRRAPSRKFALLIPALQRAPRLVRAGLYVRGLMQSAHGTSEGSLTRRGTWILAAKMLGFILSVAFPLLLVRRLPRDEFGLYRQVFLIINTATTVLPLSVGMSVYYFLPRTPDKKGAVAANVLLFLLGAGSLGALTLLWMPWVAVWLAGGPGIVPYIPGIAAVTLLWTVGSVIETMMLANQEVRLAALTSVAVQAMRATLFVAAVLVLPSLKAVLIAAILQGFLQCVGTFIYLSSRFGNLLRQLSMSLLRQQLSYAIPLGLAGLLYGIQADLHNYFVSRHFGSATFAIYSVGCLDLPILGLLYEALSSVLIPHISVIQQQGATEKIIDVTFRSMRKMAHVAFPVSAFLLVVSPEFLTMLFTDRYAESVPVFRWNLAMIPLGVLITDPILRAYSRYRYAVLGLHVVLFVLQFSVLQWALSRFGIVSAIMIVVATSFLERSSKAIWCGYITGFGRRHMPLVWPLLRILLAASLSALVATAVKYSLPPLPKLLVLAVCGTAFSLCHIGLVYVFRALTPEELELAGRVVPARWRKYAL